MSASALLVVLLYEDTDGRNGGFLYIGNDSQSWNATLGVHLIKNIRISKHLQFSLVQNHIYLLDGCTVLLTLLTPYYVVCA